MLMLHDRLIAAEERICNLSAELDRRAPEIPAIPKGISVDHATRGCFFRFLAKPGTWPAYSELEAQEEVTKRLLTALMALYDSDTGYTSVTFCQSPLLEASSNDVAMSTAIHNMGHEAGQSSCLKHCWQFRRPHWSKGSSAAQFPPFPWQRRQVL